MSMFEMFTGILEFLILPTGLWVLLAMSLSIPVIQRHVLYANKLSYKTRRCGDDPENFGFLKNQVIPYTIPTPDGESLYVWFVIPTKVYLKHESVLLATWTLEELQEIARGMLANDNNVVVLYFHDSSGTIAQDKRTEAYRSISAGDPDHIYLVSFDYRGFGRSTGSPSQSGLITDAVTMINWVHEKASIPYSRIALVGQTLGTAVAVAAVEHMLREDPYIEFAGLVLCAPFVDTASFFMNYSVGNSKPLLLPLRRINFLHKWFQGKMIDSWKTSEHIKTVVQKSDALRLTLVDTATMHPDALTMIKTIISTARRQLKKKGSLDTKTLELGNAGHIQEHRFGSTVLRHVTLQHGDAHSIMRWMPVAFEVAKVIQNSGKD